jgi:hypothetical protein
MIRRHALAIVVILISVCAFPLFGQKSVQGVFHAGKGVVPNDTPFPINFPPTPVGTTSIQDCYYNCFFTGAGTCNYSGTIALMKAVGPPFRVTNLRKGLYNSGCGGTPVTLPVTLQAGEWLLQDFEFTPTTPGSFSDTHVYNVTPTGSPTVTSTWLLNGSTPSLAPQIVSFAAVPPTVRPGKSTTLSWLTRGATSVVIDNGIGGQPASGTVTVTPSSQTTYTLTAMSGSLSSTAQVTVFVLTAPSVVISAFPEPILQVQGTGGGSSSFTVTNQGGASTNITLAQTGNFFTLNSTSFTLPAGASQNVTITANALSAGGYDGTVLVNATGFPFQLQVPVKVFSAAPPGWLGDREASDQSS